MLDLSPSPTPQAFQTHGATGYCSQQGVSSVVNRDGERTLDSTLQRLHCAGNFPSRHRELNLAYSHNEGLAQPLPFTSDVFDCQDHNIDQVAIVTPPPEHFSISDLTQPAAAKSISRGDNDQLQSWFVDVSLQQLADAALLLGDSNTSHTGSQAATEVQEMNSAPSQVVRKGEQGAGITALHLAARHGHYNVLTSLVENGADTTITDDRGWTALHIATEHGHGDIVAFLLQSGVDVNAKVRVRDAQRGEIRDHDKSQHNTNNPPGPVMW